VKVFVGRDASRSTRVVVALAGSVVLLTQLASPAIAAPDTQITSGPSGTVTQNTASFEFSSDSAGATFECSLDSAAFAACESPQTYTDLSDGTHRFQVRAVVAGEADPTPASRSWTIAGAPPESENDADSDGVADDSDLCVGTESGAALVGRGCSVLQAALDPSLFSSPASTNIRVARKGLKGAAFSDIKALLKRAKVQIREASGLLRSGEACVAATSAAGAVDSAASASTTTQEIVGAKREKLERSTGGFGDADGRQTRWIGLGVRLGLVQAVHQSVEDLQTLFDAICEQVVDSDSAQGKVIRVDDVGRVMELEDGTLFGLPLDLSGIDVYEGGVVTVDGVVFDDGAGIATSVENNGGDASPNVTVRCLGFRFAPYQPFSPPLPNPPPLVLHHPSAYHALGSYQIEQGMRVGVETLGCKKDDPKPGETYDRRSLRIDIKYKLSSGGASITQAMAYDLQPGEGPVKFPKWMGLGTKATVTVKERSATCTVVAPGNETCNVPVDVAVDTYEVKLGARGAQCQVEYTKSELDLDDHDPNDYRNVKVQPLTALNVQIIASADASDYHFEALGYKPGTDDVVKRVAGQAFSIYHHDFYSSYLLFPEESTGVDHDAGLMWPRLKGTRNGHSYWYMCRVPEVIKDVVDYCDPGPNCYYRLPWNGGDAFKVSQGNNTTFTHKGWGKYAFDFDMPSNETIQAARGGTVTFVEESLSQNCDPALDEDPDDPEGWCPGNELRIKHQDGTFSRYIHMPEDGVFVDVGDEVKRGDEIADVGNTGYSTDPHLHFEVFRAGQAETTFIRFEAKVGGKIVDCLVPKTDATVTSTNL
jgi:murein DD-endopeptidase MepM/ murein hydrolase activator NlpD